MTGRAAIASFLLLGFAILPAAAEVRRFEVEAAYNAWTLSPFNPILERRTESAVREAFRDALGTTFLGAILSPLNASAQFGASSGRSFSATVWMRLGRSRFAIGLRADAFSFRLPFTIGASETASILGIPVVRIDGRSSGTARVRGVGGTVLGRWTAVRTRRFDFDLAAGLTLFPYEGTIDQDIQADIRTLIGDATVSGPYDMTIAEARRWSNQIPSAILAPAAAARACFWLSERLGIAAGVASIQGVFFSGGLVARF